MPPTTKPIVIVESPYAAATPVEREINDRYLHAALHDCLRRGEAPFASHGLYTLPGVLDDDVPEERELGITAGFAFRRVGDLTVVYKDLGITPGMVRGIRQALMFHPVEYRRLPDVPW